MTKEKHHSQREDVLAPSASGKTDGVNPAYCDKVRIEDRKAGKK
jgi:hypothetical protein